MPAAMRVQRRLSVASEARSTSRITAYSVESSSVVTGTAPAPSNSAPLWTSRVAWPPSPRSRVGPRAAGGPPPRLLGAPPVPLERLALPGEDGYAGRRVDRTVRTDRNGRRGMVLSGEGGAGRPAHPGTGGRQRRGRR